MQQLDMDRNVKVIISLNYIKFRFFSIGLKIALDYWINKGHKVLIMLPDFCFSLDEV